MIRQIWIVTSLRWIYSCHSLIGTCVPWALILCIYWILYFSCCPWCRIYWSWLCSWLLICLSLFLKSLRMLLVSLYELYFLMWPISFLAWSTHLILKRYLFIRKPMRVWWGNSVHTKLHKIRLTKLRVAVIFLVLLRIYDLRWLLHGLSLLIQGVLNIKRLNSAMVTGRKLLLETHLCLMAFLWGNAAILVLLMRTIISVVAAKLVLNLLYWVLRWVRNGSDSLTNRHLLADVKAIFNNRTSVGSLGITWWANVLHLARIVPRFSHIL